MVITHESTIENNFGSARKYNSVKRQSRTAYRYFGGRMRKWFFGGAAASNKQGKSHQ